MKWLRVTNIQRGCVYDGPGVRTTIFLKGCSLCCPWCCNPETQSYEEECFVDDDRCLLKRGIESKLCKDCIRNNGLIPITQCPFGVADKTSRDMDTEELMEIVLKDKSLYSRTQGGVTLSGGEPLIQAESLLPFLNKLRKESISICFESTLIAPINCIYCVLSYIDVCIIDLKLQPQMMLDDKNYIEQLRMVLSLLSGKQLLYRIVFVDEMLPVKEVVVERLQYLAIDKIELLLCHSIGQKKYIKLSRPFYDYSAMKDKAIAFSEYLIEHSIEISLLTV